MMFRLNERVLCFHGPLLYEAKVLKFRDGSGEGDVESVEELGSPSPEGQYYLVHYKGWKNSWDDWVPEDRVLKWTDENLKTQKELKDATVAATAPKKKLTDKKKDTQKLDDDIRNGSAAKESPAPPGRPTKRGREMELDKEEDFMKRTEVKINVPDTLKAQLVDDWENVTKNHQLVPLPRTLTVKSLLTSFKESLPKKRPGSAEFDILEEILAGIRLYFDRSLGNILLYRFERQQYLDIRRQHPKKEASEIYGAEHLIRLFVTMPELVAHTNMDQQSVDVLRGHIESILRYLAKRKDECFVDTYQNASPSYEGLSRGS